MSKTKTINLYLATSFNNMDENKDGAWVITAVRDGEQRTLSSARPNTTNTQQAIEGILEVTEQLSQPHHIVIHTTNSTLVEQYDGYSLFWKSNNWSRSGGRSIRHLDLWKRLMKLSETHRVRFKTVEKDSNKLIHRASYMANYERTAMRLFRDKRDAKEESKTSASVKAKHYSERLELQHHQQQQTNLELL